MTAPVIHQPRVAWDGARAIVRAANTEGNVAFGDKLGSQLGPHYRDALAATRQRLSAAENENAEMGRWRVRLEDLLRSRPELTGTVQALTGQGPAR
jgi:hypothetical protein